MPISVVKSADKQYVLLQESDEIVYTVLITNTGTEEVQCVTLQDLLPASVKYIKGTLTIDGLKSKNENLVSGVSLGNIGVGGNRVASFRVKIVDCTVGSISNTAVVSYKELGVNNVAQSNTLVIPVINLSVRVQKEVDPCYALPGETLTFTIVVSNDSNIQIDNVVLTDIVDSNLTVIPSSFVINGLPQNLDYQGTLGLDTIPAHSSAIVIFKAIVSVCAAGVCIENTASVSYNYTISSVTPPLTSIGTSSSNTVVINVGPTSFKQFPLAKTLQIDPTKPGIEEILDGQVCGVVTHTHVIQTMTGTSCEGQTLTGQKLIVVGEITIRIEYVALVPSQAIHVAEFTMPFSTFIVLPANFVPAEENLADVSFGQSFFSLQDCRTVLAYVPVQVSFDACI